VTPPETKRAFKDEVYEQFARLGRALASGRRLELIDLLAQRERTVEELAEQTGMSPANTSQHLQVLRAARLVEVRRDGLYASYRLAGPEVFRLWQALRETGELRLAEIERVVRNYLHDRRALQPVTAEELHQRLRRGGVVVLDVRPAEEFEAGHIRGARSIPAAELEARLRELPKSREIVAYCRGPYCVYADEAVALLRARGYRARRLDVGFPDWQARGLPAEGGNLWQSRAL
jgi:rhodanese-related sulfurtransferase